MKVKSKPHRGTVVLTLHTQAELDALNRALRIGALGSEEPLFASECRLLRGLYIALPVSVPGAQPV